LLLRETQVRALTEATQATFRYNAAEHLRRSFPAQCAELGEAELAETVRSGMEQARAWGFESAHDVCRYLNLLVALGPAFDEAPWARECLEADADTMPATFRMDRLYARAIEENRPG